ncbi:uncharacterized protein LOC115710230 [Cannabis sativa]|uniref:uncharacterized protein LOC115710230 n=1 Tax=Cannabis sativa TaxID=3483 RepID=UPI0029CA30DE|nr:uncharacterized protein LOC115710230 [Cannabis sativa]
MRNIATCYNEHATKVSDSYCSGSSNLSYLNPKLNHSSIPNQVTCIYKANLSNQTQVLITLTWFSNLAPGIRVTQELKHSEFKRLWKKKGTETFRSSGFKIEVFWDICEAKYGIGPEPVNGFYVVVLVEKEMVLILGDKQANIDEIDRVSKRKSLLVSRSEKFSGHYCVYSTKAQFSDNGMIHEIVVKCGKEKDGRNDHDDHSCEEEEEEVKRKGSKGSKVFSPVLSVCIDRKTIFQERKLRWNFRGNHAIFLDGLVVDLMWDVHDWFFNTTSGCAVFMFRTRSGFHTRLWLEDTILDQKKDQEETAQFSLLICACGKMGKC